MEIKGKINMQQKKISKSAQRTAKTLFTWGRGPRFSGVGFFCFVSPRAWTQKKPTPPDRGPRTPRKQALRLSYVSKMKTEQIARQRGINQEIKVSWVIRRAGTKLTYFSGFTTAIYWSSTRLCRFIIEAYRKNHLVKSAQEA